VAKNEIIMRKIILVFACLGLSLGAFAQNYKWQRTAIDGSRTGVVSPSADNVKEALGEVKGKKYYAPSGKVYKGTTAEVAKLIIDAQSEMAAVKKVIGYSPAVMEKYGPESELSNFTVDVVMDRVGKEMGKKIDVGITNFGGIRVDMPKGDIIVDDIMSMFPFKNNIVYVEVKGSRLREVLEGMAAKRVEVIGGMKIVVENRKLVSVTIGGEPLQDDKIYTMATITFLLHGGDRLYLGEGMETVKELEVSIYDAMSEYIIAETSAGRPITGKKDGRVVIKK
jgi:2',3'-cyclic-nucleotide 2'-phosphodiesterase (5'-nucleotidase family)